MAEEVKAPTTIVCPSCYRLNEIEAESCVYCRQILKNYDKINYLLTKDPKISAMNEKYTNSGSGSVASVGISVFCLLMLYQNDTFYHNNIIFYCAIIGVVLFVAIAIALVIRRKILEDKIWDAIDEELENPNFHIRER